MQNLFIVESPFQMLSAIEGANYFKGEENTLIVSYSSEDKNNEQIRMVLECYQHWDHVIELAPSRYSFLTGIKLLHEMKKLIESDYRPRRIFIGEYRSRFMTQFFHSMTPHECFLLDDGNITIELQEKYLKNNKPYGNNSIKSRVKNLMLAILTGVRQEETILIHLFTCFDLQPFDTRQSVIKHTFDFAKSFSKKKLVEQTTVFFFGGNFSGLGMLPIKREIELIEAAKNYYEKMNLKMVYVPHRRESEGKVKMVRHVLNLDVIRFQLPAEIEILKLDTLPYGIASFCSTVLFTLPRIANFSSVDSFQLPISEMPEQLQSEIAKVYSTYRNSGFIQVLEVL